MRSREAHGSASVRARRDEILERHHAEQCCAWNSSRTLEPTTRPAKRYVHSYNFPPSPPAAGRVGSKRREIRPRALAETSAGPGAAERELPLRDPAGAPEALESSTARPRWSSVCASTLSLLNAQGVPLKAPVAGVSRWVWLRLDRVDRADAVRRTLTDIPRRAEDARTARRMDTKISRHQRSC